MTLTAAWVRKVGSIEELVVASDSRLRFGKAWDCCPKVFTLPRSDAVICFAHNTAYAYPIIEQVRIAIDQYPKAKSRALDLGSLRGHLQRVMNGMLPFLHDQPKGMSAADDLDTVFILAGFCWRVGDFRIWEFRYDRKAKEFRYDSAVRFGGRMRLFSGDHIREAKQRLSRIMRERDKAIELGYDMEPFEVLRDMIRDRSFPTIGGPPQVLKVYEHLNVKPYAVLWPNADGGVTCMGRTLLDYERTNLLILDPDSLATFTADQIDTQEAIGS